jgi:hypothetical protein
VAHICNPSSWGGRDQEDCSLKPAHSKSYQDLISTNKLDVVVHISNPSYMEGVGRIVARVLHWAEM